MKVCHICNFAFDDFTKEIQKDENGNEIIITKYYCSVCDREEVIL